MILLTNFQLQASDLDCRSHCMDSQPQDRVDPYPCHLGVWSSPNSSAGGAHLCYSLVWSCDLQLRNRQPPSSQQLEQNSPPQKKKSIIDVTIPHLLQHACVACASLWASPLPSPSAPNPQMPSGLWSLDRSNQILTKTDGLSHWRWGFLRQKFGDLLWLNCCAYWNTWSKGGHPMLSKKRM